jgi:prevent-host-death family protein
VPELSLWEASHQLSDIVRRAADQDEETIITVDGEPMAAVISVKGLESLKRTIDLLSDEQQRFDLRQSALDKGTTDAEDVWFEMYGSQPPWVTHPPALPELESRSLWPGLPEQRPAILSPEEAMRRTREQLSARQTPRSRLQGPIVSLSPEDVEQFLHPEQPPVVRASPFADPRTRNLHEPVRNPKWYFEQTPISRYLMESGDRIPATALRQFRSLVEKFKLLRAQWANYEVIDDRRKAAARDVLGNRFKELWGESVSCYETLQRFEAFSRMVRIVELQCDLTFMWQDVIAPPIPLGLHARSRPVPTRQEVAFQHESCVRNLTLMVAERIHENPGSRQQISPLIRPPLPPRGESVQYRPSLSHQNLYGEE